jgi:hypothetical protein
MEDRSPPDVEKETISLDDNDNVCSGYVRRPFLFAFHLIILSYFVIAPCELFVVVDSSECPPRLDRESSFPVVIVMTQKSFWVSGGALGILTSPANFAPALLFGFLSWVSFLGLSAC